MLLFRINRPLPAPRPVREYSVEEQGRLRIEFVPVVSAYHRRRRISFIWSAVALVSLAAALIVKPPVFWYAVRLAGFTGLAAALTHPQFPRCPGCGERLGTRFGQFCPHCGSKIQRNSPNEGPHCPSCNKTLAWGKYRNFKIRGCTHCGLALDDKGM